MTPGLRVAMRADASVSRGAGHVSRCLTLAAAVRARGGTVRFVARALPANVHEWVVAQGHVCSMFADAGDDGERPVHGIWSADRQASDAHATIRVLHGRTWDWVVVDHYNLDERWETEVAAGGARILALDDLADRMHRCDVLLDQNLPVDRQRYHSLVPPSCRVLLGPRFALVRDEFLQARRTSRHRDGEIRRVLVSFGFGDEVNDTLAAVEACTAAGFGDGQVDVVLGGLSPHRASVEAACSRAGYRLHMQSSSMAALMEEADLAIGAAGSTSWERCAVGLPAVTISTAVNQQRVIAGLEAEGAIVTVGSGGRTRALATALVGLRVDPARVLRMAASARRLVDGLGAVRVWEVMV